jgi:hypothetical protein
MSERAVFVTGGIGFIGIMQLLLWKQDLCPVVHGCLSIQGQQSM